MQVTDSNSHALGRDAGLDHSGEVGKICLAMIRSTQGRTKIGASARRVHAEKKHDGCKVLWPQVTSPNPRHAFVSKTLHPETGVGRAAKKSMTRFGVVPITQDPKRKILNKTKE